MTAAAEMPSVTSGGLSVGPDLSPLEQSRQALRRIESKLCEKLKVIASFSSPAGIDDVQSQSTKAEMEAQDAENEVFPYKAVTEFSELYQIYESLMIDTKTPLAMPKGRTSEFEEVEKKIETLWHQASQRNASLKLDLRGLLLHSIPESIQKLSSTLVKLELSNNNLHSFPESVTSLVNLVHLDVHSNQLISLPNSIGRLVKLKVFIVSGNCISELPLLIYNEL